MYSLFLLSPPARFSVFGCEIGHKTALSGVMSRAKIY